jgi:hypothetical protein
MHGLLLYGWQIAPGVAACATDPDSNDRLKRHTATRAATRTGNASLRATAGPRRSIPNIFSLLRTLSGALQPPDGGDYSQIL